jgi:hypothetical protein
MMDTIRREYKLKWWAQAYYLASGVLVMGIGTFGAHASISAAHWSSFKDWCDFLVPAEFAALGCYFFALALRSRVALQGTHIAVRYAIRERSADLSEIAGYGTYTRRKLSFLHFQKYVTFWHLQLRGSSDFISIMQSFDVDDYFYAWLQQLPDLDKGSLNL